MHTPHPEGLVHGFWTPLCPSPNCSPSVAFPTEACPRLHPAQMRSVMGSSFPFPRPLPFVPLLLILCVELTLSSLSLRQGFRPAICPSSHDSQERQHPRNLSWPLKIHRGKGLKRISFAFLHSYHLQCGWVLGCGLHCHCLRAL